MTSSAELRHQRSEVIGRKSDIEANVAFLARLATFGALGAGAELAYESSNTAVSASIILGTTTLAILFEYNRRVYTKKSDLLAELADDEYYREHGIV